MKNSLEMRLFSRRLLTQTTAMEQITALSEFTGGLMRPDKCGEFEPIKIPFDPSDIREPVGWLIRPHGTFSYRKGRPTHVSGAMWNLTHSPDARFPSPVFINYWTGEFDGKWVRQVGLEKIEEFVTDMFGLTRADFALLTTEADLNAKNRPTDSFSYKGMDLATGVPGLYWANFFSPGYAEWLGLGQLRNELAPINRLPGGGVSIKFCESLEHCRDIQVLQRQRAAIEWLGPEKFFDVRSRIARQLPRTGITCL